MRRVLIIASRFPPLASVGAIRIRKFVKYLGDFGWEPVVLTGPIPSVTEATEDARRLLDNEGLSDVPEHGIGLSSPQDLFHHHCVFRRFLGH